MRVLALLLPIVLRSTLIAGPIYSITDLGSGTATALNESGGVAGWSVDPFGTLHGFVFDGASRTDLGGGTQAFAIGSSGAAYGATLDGAGNAAATRWTTPSSSMGIAGPVSVALAVNDSGTAAGAANGAAVTFSNGGSTAVGPATTWSAAYAINESGAVAGTARQTNGSFGAFVFVPGIGAVWLRSLGGANSYGAAINGSGVVAGTSQNASRYLHAASWSNGMVTDLGTLGGANSGAYAIASNGDIAGYSLTASGASAAFLYSGGRMLDLNALLGDPDWVLEAAYAINSAGQIAGSGIYQGARHAFLLSPIAAAPSVSANGPESPVPEPSPAALLAIPLALLALPILKRK